jgi:uncharacterized OB-fold protein
MPRSMQECHELGQHAQYPRANCPECQKAIAAKPKCEDCGFVVAPGRKYCAECTRDRARARANTTTRPSASGADWNLHPFWE